MSETDQHKTRQAIERWFADGDTWVGVFENHDLGSQQVGVRCAFPFTLSNGSMEASRVGSTKAPDGSRIGMGWRYVLVAKCRTADEAMAALFREVTHAQ